MSNSSPAAIFLPSRSGWGTKAGMSGAGTQAQESDAEAGVKRAVSRTLEARPRRHGSKLARKQGRFGLTVFWSGVTHSDAAGRQ